MATATPTRTLADVYRERLEAAEPFPDELGPALHAAISAMAPYDSETEDLRPSEIAWLDERYTAAQDAAREAVIAAVAEVFGRELPRLLPSRDDYTVPLHLWEQGGDAISGDAELAAEGADR